MKVQPVYMIICVGTNQSMRKRLSDSNKQINILNIYNYARLHEYRVLNQSSIKILKRRSAELAA